MCCRAWKYGMGTSRIFSAVSFVIFLVLKRAVTISEIEVTPAVQVGTQIYYDMSTFQTFGVYLISPVRSVGNAPSCALRIVAFELPDLNYIIDSELLLCLLRLPRPPSSREHMAINGRSRSERRRRTDRCKNRIIMQNRSHQLKLLAFRMISVHQI
jgi:hypothetical protein